MKILFVNNHIKGLQAVQEICSKENLLCGGTLISKETPILGGYSYAISPCEAGFDYTISLFDKFDEVIFLTDHDSDVVKLLQLELQKIVYQKEKYIVSYTSKILDQDKINYFGCSHTAGMGHNNQPTAYPDVLSKLLKCKYNNFGLPGQSNYAIEDLLNTYTIKNSKCVIQFTDMYRLRYMENNAVIGTGKSYDFKWNISPFLKEENLFFNFRQLVIRIVNRLREGENKFIITHTANIDNEYAIKCTEFLYGFCLLYTSPSPRD